MQSTDRAHAPKDEYTTQIVETIESVNAADWRQVWSACNGPLFMDTRLIGAVEAGLRQTCDFWHVIIYDRNAIPVACASLSTVTIDLADLAHPELGRAIRRFSGVLSKFRTLKLFLCGLPVSAGQNNLAIVPGGNLSQVLSTLDRVVCDLTTESKAHTVVYKEFTEDEMQAMKPLLNLGYRFIPTPPMHCLKPAFENFEQYGEALRSHYRYKIQRSIRKLRRASIEVSVLTDPEQMLRTYTPEVHELYHQVLERSETRVETLTIDFFHALAKSLPSETELIVLSRNARVVAFAWSLKMRATYHLLFVGLDYALNAEHDLYFNLLYVWMDYAFRSGASSIKVGQTTDSFKARLGCYSEPRYVFMKGVGPVMSVANRVLAGLVVAQEKQTSPLNVFRNELDAEDV